MSELGEREENAGVPRDTGSLTTKPGWLPFLISGGIMAVLLSGPYLLHAVAPEAVEGKVGVFERVTLTTATNEGSAIGGFIAPEGWMALEVEPGDSPDGGGSGASDGASTKDSDDETDRGDKAPVPMRSFVSPDGRASITVELHANVVDPAKLLRESASVGAALIPTNAPAAVNGLDILRVNYDLRVGSGSTQLVTACTTFSTTNCVLITSKASAWFGDERLNPLLNDGYLLTEVQAMVESVEVFG